MNTEFLRSQSFSRIIVILFVIFTVFLTFSAVYQFDSTLLGFEDKNSSQEAKEQKVIEQNQDFELESAASISGQFSQEVDYESPGGVDRIEVNLEFEKNILISASVTEVKANSTSADYIKGFDSELEDKIVGKSIDDDLDPGKLSGASLTRVAFVEALNLIRDQAIEDSQA